MSEHLQCMISALDEQIKQLQIQVNKTRKPTIERQRDVPGSASQTNYIVNEPIVKSYDFDNSKHRSSNQSSNVSLDTVNALPIFNGEKNKYATWRSMTSTAMMPLMNQKTTMLYFQALLIIRRTKITGSASNVLDDENFTFENIINQLDLIYAVDDKLCNFDEEKQISTDQLNNTSDELSKDECSPNVIITQIGIEQLGLATTEIESNVKFVVPESFDQVKNIQHININEDKRFILKARVSGTVSSSNIDLKIRKREEKIQRVNKVNDRNFILSANFRTAVYWDNERSLKRRVKLPQTTQLFQVYFMNGRIIDMLIENNIFKRENRRNLYKYFREKNSFIFFSFCESILSDLHHVFLPIMFSLN